MFPYASEESLHNKRFFGDATMQISGCLLLQVYAES